MHTLQMNTIELIALVLIFMAPYFSALYLVFSAIRLIKNARSLELNRLIDAANTVEEQAK